MAINIKMTTHFQYRMESRRIDIDRIKKVCEFPDSTRDAGGGNSWSIKKFGEKRLKVVYCKERLNTSASRYLLITAYYI